VNVVSVVARLTALRDAVTTNRQVTVFARIVARVAFLHAAYGTATVTVRVVVVVASFSAHRHAVTTDRHTRETSAAARPTLFDLTSLTTTVAGTCVAVVTRLTTSELRVAAFHRTHAWFPRLGTDIIRLE
jgi:hypothetical protein